MSLKKKLLIYFAKKIGYKIYDPKYLKGKYFEKVDVGWLWVLKGLLFQKILSFNKNVPWPVAHTVLVNNWKNIHFDSEDVNIFQTNGSYFQAQDAHIYIGKGTWIAPNVGLITTNHNIYNVSEHAGGQNVRIGEKCWIGMNSVVLPGVELGKNTIVAAGAVVTKSFPEGYCVIGGVPARILKRIEIEKCVE